MEVGDTCRVFTEEGAVERMIFVINLTTDYKVGRKIVIDTFMKGK